MSATDARAAVEETARSWSILAGRVEALLRAWEAGPAVPELAAFLPAEPPALRQMTLVELIKVDLEQRWQRRRGLRLIEDYLREFPELAEDLPPDLIYEEYHVRKHAGESVEPGQYLARFPRRARELERLFALHGAAGVSTALAGRQGAAAAQELSPGDRIDEFDLLAKLGEGAFASVFLARQNSMQRLVALKVSADRGTEPQTLAQLDHDQIVRVYDQRVLPERGLRLLYMQYVAGGTLQGVVDEVRRTSPAERTGALLYAVVARALDARGDAPPAVSALRERLRGAPWPEVVCWIGARLARGLDHAHRQGVLHRDIKPANVLLTAEGSPRLADFNISFSAQLEGATPAAYFGGSLAYMSPEQMEACNPSHERTPDSLDGRSDLYSLGVMLWELLAGARPFADEPVSGNWSRTLEAMTARRRAGVEPARLQSLAGNWPAGLDQVLSRCLDPDPSRRFASGADLARRLELCLAPRAGRLLAPPAQNWRRIGRAQPLVWIILAAMLPNLAAAVFNYSYNRREIVEHLADAQDVFWRTQLVINAIAFPLGLGLAAGLSWPVVRAVRDRAALDALPADSLQGLRRRCLWLGHFAAGISLALWLLAAPAYPIALSSAGQHVPAGDWLHFVASLALCGLIAAAYPFFGVTCVAVCSLYPALVRLETMTGDDAQGLSRLGRASWVYLALAASVPMASVAVLVLVGSRAQFALGLLAAGGLAGLATAFSLFRLLQADLAGLVQIATPGDLGETTTQSLEYRL